VDPTDLTGPERRVWQAFARGEPVDLGDGEPAGEWGTDRCVRAEVLVRLLLGAVAAEPGFTPKLALAGARITGPVDLSNATVTCELRLTRCWLDEPFDASDAKLRNVTLHGCRITALNLWAVDVDGSVSLADCQVSELNLGGARIGGRLRLTGNTLSNPGGQALTGTRLAVGNSMICRDTTVHGELRLVDATIGTALILTGTTLSNPGGRALAAAGITVERTVYCTDGFQATGRVMFRRGRIHGQLAIDGTIDGTLDLRDAQIHALRMRASDGPAANLDGLTYDHLIPEELEHSRIRWLQRDPDGYRAQPYEQLAEHYRRLGYDRRARMVLLAKRRAHSHRLPPRWRFISWSQDVLSGYGYAPGRAVGWLVAAWAVGTAYFAVDRPDGDGAFYSPLYALDVLLPTSPLRVEGSFTPEGAGFWLAIGLQVLGWALSIAVLPALTRALSRS
jgi:hypothetical protein